MKVLWRVLISAFLLVSLSSAVVLQSARTPARAESLYSFTGSVVQGDATFTRPFPDCTGPSAAVVPYQVHEMMVPTSGLYDLSVSAIAIGPSPFPLDLILFVYAGSFNPGAPLVNCLYGADDPIPSLLPVLTDVALTAGATYYVVIAKFASSNPDASYVISTDVPMPAPPPVPVPTTTVPAPGPDLVAIPSGAVVGMFVVDTPIYWAPQADAVTSIIMQASKTVWVFGVDASGTFYKVMLAGKLFWVPVGTMGPNPDAVWQNTPLPTQVVK